MLNNTDKIILYNMLEREVDNLLVGIPILSAFSSVISNTLIKYIEPYVNAFTSHGQLDAEQLTAFAANEMNEKIQKFKQQYEEEKANHGNESNF